jgi:DamX protein
MAPDAPRIPEPEVTPAASEPAPMTSVQARDTSNVTPDTVSPPPQPKVAAIPATAEPTHQPPADAAPAAETRKTAAPETSEQPAPTASEKQQPPQPEPAVTGGPHREDWLLQQPPARYSLQLLGSRQQSSIRAYIKQNRLDPERCAYYKGKFQGGDWYVLMYGVYPDRQSALAARTALPARVQKEKPWPRNLTSVHNAIRAAK